MPVLLVLLDSDFEATAIYEAPRGKRDSRFDRARFQIP